MSVTNPDVDVEVSSFAPGYLDTPEEDTLVPGAMPDGKNWILTHLEAQDQIRARLRKRPGNRLLTPANLLGRYDGLFTFEREGSSSELLAVANGELRKFDNVDTLTLIGSGFTPGNAARFLPFKDEVFVSDGTVNKRYNGTSLLGVGFAKPTAAPGLAAVAGPGITGTFEGFAVWYDTDADHESSPSDTSAPVTLANQQRQWTKPAGSPPANVTHWRVYCRRTDTNESLFFRIPNDIPIATTTYVESFSDTARNEKGPDPSSNDVPPAFALMEEYKGYRIGVTENSSLAYISKFGDPESQHPKDVFPVGGKGDQKAVRSVRKYATECLIQKPRKTYHLVGDRLPFKIDPIMNSFGNVSQEAGMEVDGWLFAWDEHRGPYRTNLETWDALADTRIENQLALINRSALHKIKIAHFTALHIVVWFVPQDSTGRTRIGLPYNYKLNRWWAPMIGLEWCAFAEYTTPDGNLNTYCGDEWGRLFRMFDGENDGVGSGMTVAAITGATADAIQCAGASFNITGAGLRGLRAAVRSPSGTWQWVRVASNDTETLLLDITNSPSLSPVPGPFGAGMPEWIVIVGGIEWDVFTPRHHFGQRFVSKRGWHLFIEGTASADDHVLEARARYDRSLGFTDSYSFTFPVQGLVWGVGKWGVDQWSGGEGLLGAQKERIGRSFRDVQYQFFNYFPNQPIELTGYRITADLIRRRFVGDA